MKKALMSMIALILLITTPLMVFADAIPPGHPLSWHNTSLVVGSLEWTNAKVKDDMFELTFNTFLGMDSPKTMTQQNNVMLYAYYEYYFKDSWSHNYWFNPLVVSFCDIKVGYASNTWNWDRLMPDIILYSKRVGDVYVDDNNWYIVGTDPLDGYEPWDSNFEFDDTLKLSCDDLADIDGEVPGYDLYVSLSCWVNVNQNYLTHLEDDGKSTNIGVCDLLTSYGDSYFYGISNCHSTWGDKWDRIQKFPQMVTAISLDDVAMAFNWKCPDWSLDIENATDEGDDDWYNPPNNNQSTNPKDLNESDGDVPPGTGGEDQGRPDDNSLDKIELSDQVIQRVVVQEGSYDSILAVVEVVYSFILLVFYIIEFTIVIYIFTNYIPGIFKKALEIIKRAGRFR